MDRYPGYESMLARVEHMKSQVKGQLAPEQSHLVDDLVVFVQKHVLDLVNECCNVPTADASTDTNEDHLLADGPVAPALDTRSEVNEQTNLVNTQVDHHFQGSISNEQTVSPQLVTQSTIPANIEVKVEDVSDGQSVQLCKRVKKEEGDGGEFVMDCDCGECEICRVKREMKEELDESGETEQMEDCVKQEIKEELEDGEMMHIKEEEEEDGEVEGERPNKIQRMDRVLGNVPVGSLSPSTNGIPINVQYIDDQVATSSTHQIEDHTQTYQPVTVPFADPIVTPSSSAQHVNETIRDELLNAEPMMDNVALVVEVGGEEFDREQIDHDNNSTLNPVHIDQDGEETEVDDNQQDEEEDGDETIEQRQDTRAGYDQQVPAENFVKRIEPDELGNKFECDYQTCGRRMKKRTDLIRHIRTHTGEKRFKCTVNGCDRSFVQKNQLRSHLNTHSGTRLFVCSWPSCEARFGTKCNLTGHLRTHTGERPFECDQCDDTFTHQSNLLTHLRTHTGARPFVCTWPECGQAFAQSGNLKKHSLTHSNERQFVCDVRGCTKAYKRKEELRQHQKAKHN